jgi:plastocyanin
MVRRFPYTSAVVLLSVASLLMFGMGAAQSVRSHAVLPAASDQLTVTVGTLFSFSVSTDEVTPGDTVALTIVQTDDTEHTFTLSSVTNATLPTSDGQGQLYAYFAAHPPLVNFTIPSGQGTYTMSFVAPPYGLYEYLCLVSGHFAAGMAGILGSGEHGGTITPDTGPGAPVFIIGGTIAGLVVLAIVLGFVVGRRRGSHDEMPPERLGYPETGGPAPPKPH